MQLAHGQKEQVAIGELPLQAEFENKMQAESCHPCHSSCGIRGLCGWCWNNTPSLAGCKQARTTIACVWYKLWRELSLGR